MFQLFHVEQIEFILIKWKIISFLKNVPRGTMCGSPSPMTTSCFLGIVPRGTF